MKKALVIVTLAAGLLAATASATPTSPPVVEPAAAPAMSLNMDRIEQNLLNLFGSNNLDLRVGAIQLVLELKRCCPAADLDYTIIPLLSCLRDESSPELRVMAGAALHELDTHLGRYAVERRALYDSSEWAARQLKHISRAWDLERTPIRP